MTATAKRWVTVGPAGFLSWYPIVWGVGMGALALEWLNDIGTTWDRTALFVGLTLPLVAGAAAHVCESRHRDAPTPPPDDAA